jgi:hypothetical protein
MECDIFFVHSNRSLLRKEQSPHTRTRVLAALLAPCHMECDIFFLYSNPCSFFSCFAIMFVCVSTGHTKEMLFIVTYF